MEEYKKHFSDKLTDYSEFIKKIEEEHKKQDKKYGQLMALELEKKKAIIRKQEIRKAKTSKEKDKVKELQEEMKSKKVEDKNKRDEEIIRAYNELKLGKTKASSRNVANLVISRGYKVSHVTVKTVLDDYHSTDKGNENTVK